MRQKEQFSAIILAAGLSSRMGHSKQLLQVDGLSMLDHAIQAALTAGIAAPIVVLGHNAPEIQSQSCLLHNCSVIINNSFRSGMSSSLICGVKAAPLESSAYIFMHADQPLVTGTLLSNLFNAFEKNSPDILYPIYHGQRGNPAIFSSNLRERLLKATGDSGARFLFSDKNLKIVKQSVSTPAIITDIDTPEDYKNVTKQLIQ